MAVGIAALALLWVQGSEASGGFAQASATKSVHIRNFAFHPPTLRVAKGSRVAFVNSSGVTHTATHGGLFNKLLKPGARAVVRFTQRGIIRYHCNIHPFMRGKIVVE